MNLTNASRLVIEAEKVAKLFSNPSRQYNFNGESFAVEEIRPLSDSTATVIMKKNSGVYAMVFFYYVKGGDFWGYFFPTDSHVLGMAQVSDIKAEIERRNFEARKIAETKINTTT